MKKNLAIVLSLIIFAGSIYATNVIQPIQADLRADVSIELNGSLLQLKDAAGNAVYPISYNGTTYLPVRSVAENLNLDVQWIGETKTVKLAQKSDNSSTVINKTTIINNSTTIQNGKIKGNKNSMIYHMPNGMHYDKVSEKNAVYFDTEEDAIKAGYRRAEN